MVNLSELDKRLSGRIVVVSPHLDDAVLSLGATMAMAVEAGARVEVLTVFGCEPGSSAPADSWDLKSGFSTEGVAAKARRVEDHAACSILGVTTRWLDFSAAPYERSASAQQVLASVAEATAAADTVLIPGYPLAHNDHATLGNGLLTQRLNCRWLGLFAEQPYAFDHRMQFHGPVETPPPPKYRVDHEAAPGSPNGVQSYDDAVEQRSAAGYTWQHVTVKNRHRRSKLDAVKQYRSQTGLLGLRQPLVGHLRLQLMLWYEARQGGEAIAWPKAT